MRESCVRHGHDSHPGPGRVRARLVTMPTRGRHGSSELFLVTPHQGAPVGDRFANRAEIRRSCGVHGDDQKVSAGSPPCRAHCVRADLDRSGSPGCAQHAREPAIVDIGDDGAQGGPGHWRAIERDGTFCRAGETFCCSGGQAYSVRVDVGAATQSAGSARTS